MSNLGHGNVRHQVQSLTVTYREVEFGRQQQKASTFTLLRHISLDGSINHD